MESPILKQIAKFLQEKQRYKRWLAVFMCLALVVGFGTTALLKMRGRAMTHDEKVLNCKLQVHQHTDECYADPEKKELICGYADYVIHKHNDDCYDANGNLVCTLPELEAHTHTDECYQEQDALVCGQEESQGHQHTEGCYTKEQGELECTLEEHAHSEECYAEDGTLACELEEHAHADECYAWNETLTCQEAESEGHTHTAECHGTDKVLVCQKPELELHVHTKECYDKIMVTPEGEEVVLEEKEMPGEVENPGENIIYRRVCGKLQLEEHTHTQENGCIEIHEVLDASDLEQQQPAAEDGSQPAQTTEDGTQPAQTPQDGMEEEKPIVKAFEGDGFKVIAEYKKDAGIPDEAELRAEQITAESDEAHYAEREAEFKQNLDDENATMKALLKVGFYVGEEKIQPQSPVTLTVQLLGTDGLPEGTPMTIVHFGEEGTEKLEGSKAKNNATSFEMNGFSEIAIGYGEEDSTANKVRVQKDGAQTISVDQSYEYETTSVHMTFHVMGEVTLPEDKGDKESDAEPNKAETASDKPDGQEEEKETVSGKSDSQEEEKDTASDTSDSQGEEKETTEPSPAENAAPQTGAESAGETVQPDMEEPASEGEAGVEQKDSAEPMQSAEDAASGNNENGDKNSADEESGDRKAADEDTSKAGVDKADASQSGKDADDKAKDNNADKTKASNDDKKDLGEEASIVKNGDENEALKLKVKMLEDDSEEYEAIEDYLKESNRASDLLGMHVLNYTLTYEDAELDLSKCKVTAKITTSEALKEQAGKSVSEAISYLDDEAKNTNEKEPTALVLTAFSVNRYLEVEEEGAITMTENADSEEVPEGLEEEIQYELDGNTLGYSEESVVNPQFSVQYYAWLDRVSDDPKYKSITTGTNTNELTIIDTETGSKNGEGGKLPQNKDMNLPTKKIYIKTAGNEQPEVSGIENGNIITEKKLMEVYADKDFKYVESPNLNYFNSLVDNGRYKLAAVWIARTMPIPEGASAEQRKEIEEANKRITTSIERNDWKVYSNSPESGEEPVDANYNSAKDSELKDLHFTNKRETATEYGYVLIDENTVIRLVYDITDDPESFSGTLYDYDIGTLKSKVDNTNFMMETKEQGINKAEAVQTGDARYAFGNQNAGTAFGTVLWDGNLLNAGNKVEKGAPQDSFAGCTFGLVTKAKENNVEFAGGIEAPEVFGNSALEGAKTVYEGEDNLVFNRKGDTYTLTSVGGAGKTLESLEKFNNPQAGEKVYYHIWTNNFWPMDDVPAENRADELFGDYRYAAISGSQRTQRFGTNMWQQTFPASDDGLDHNSYFGMYYSVDFNLEANYTGPLEYYFFGDDDMWVFLDDETLVCDIGGVHSSVGEYVNLWDYIPRNEDGTAKDPGNHTLKFFYTERGASGSTCWMQFTLPSASNPQPERDYGYLEVSKQVTDKKTGNEVETDEEFEFEIKFTDANGNTLRDDFSYWKYDADGNELKKDIIVWSGGTFTLKKGEHIEVKFLPIGAKFEIIEKENNDEFYYTKIDVDDTTQRTDDDITTQKKATGQVTQKGQKIEVIYNNMIRKYELPKTGSIGTNLYTMAGVAAVLLGAGLMYRKKFRERRVGGSS